MNFTENYYNFIICLKLSNWNGKKNLTFSLSMLLIFFHTNMYKSFCLLWFFYLLIVILLKRQRNKDREFPSAGSHARPLRQPELGQDRARSWGATRVSHRGGRDPRTWVVTAASKHLSRKAELEAELGLKPSHVASKPPCPMPVPFVLSHCAQESVLLVHPNLLT